mmetsp:Transcript_16617/g.62931  ORF Transcript_16617/g.62931 Transcript_16617/m.62931 type:complete len:250 (-) Transcript_16617:20-769(-)
MRAWPLGVRVTCTVEAVLQLAAEKTAARLPSAATTLEEVDPMAATEVQAALAHSAGRPVKTRPTVTGACGCESSTMLKLADAAGLEPTASVRPVRVTVTPATSSSVTDTDTVPTVAALRKARSSEAELASTEKRSDPLRSAAAWSTRLAARTRKSGLAEAKLVGLNRNAAPVVPVTVTSEGRAASLAKSSAAPDDSSVVAGEAAPRRSVKAAAGLDATLASITRKEAAPMPCATAAPNTDAMRSKAAPL